MCGCWRKFHTLVCLCGMVWVYSVWYVYLHVCVCVSMVYIMVYGVHVM